MPSTAANSLAGADRRGAMVAMAAVAQSWQSGATPPRQRFGACNRDQMVFSTSGKLCENGLVPAIVTDTTFHAATQ
jgi:hypothetical protein